MSKDRKYYYLTVGDYIQSGDEYFDKTNERWKLIHKSYFGQRYGYDIEGNEFATWAEARRLVPHDFAAPDRTVVIDEQWGLEFDL